MTQATAQFLVDALTAYVACGAMFALMFLWRWVGRLDPLAARGTLGFRVLVFPGVTALWPLFVVRLVRGDSAPLDEWTAHRATARAHTGDVVSRRRR
jgi:hypothetical protein